MLIFNIINYLTKSVVTKLFSDQDFAHCNNK